MTVVDGPLDVDTLLRRHAAARPRAPAVKDEQGCLSWAAFDARVNEVADALIATGVEPGDRVAILGRNDAICLQVLFGCLRAGGCFTPLSGLASEAALVLMLADCRPRVLFVRNDGDSALVRAATELPELGGMRAIALDPASRSLQSFDAFLSAGGRAHGRVWPPADPASPFNLIYSSGTTGTPKGIVQDRAFRAQEAADMAAAFALNGDTRTLVSTPLYSNTTLFLLVSTLAAGGCVDLMDKFDTTAFLRRVEAGATTHAVLVPVQYVRLLADPDFDDADLSSFRTKFCTSAPLTPSLKHEILRRWPAGGLVEFYGMTEGGVNCTLFAHERPDKLDTVGQPAPDCDLRIVDEEGRELPPGVVGEIVGRGPKMMQGYLNRDAATREASWYDAQGRRFHRSGDLGWLDDENFLHLLDRKKDMIISGGFNVYATDLEAVLQEHQDVVEAAVIAASSEAWGETPVAFVVRADGSEIDAEALRRWANAKLGKAQRISAVKFCEALPRSPIGKVLKRDLRSLYEAQADAAP